MFPGVDYLPLAATDTITLKMS